MTETKSSGPRQLQLVNSSRLQALRSKSAQTTESAKIQTPAKPTKPSEDPETARLRHLVEQKLSQILANLPAGKQHSLFKIRFGVELETLYSLPPQEAAKTLKIKI